ncbi:MAG: hypothetical protein N3E45_14830 [Oscillatoriaceae bacterium SKW80]|nr:hypothetical protein [Oscillatoriaceae bacterium SKYG93]MCX8122073.1 hypothetical protein [Oscillatoriaceae bacterium SKW80]MDW8454360.1 hypothetical protein [Oscillatoriaceae cyanobacterium SKYGB_i_bin93]HIK29224.1 hypothetical protein [Oscillatoriaceae cyanobacterium M7585_C2015_266]
MTSSFMSANDLRAYLEQQEKSELIELILERAKNDTAWRDYLLMKAASSRPQGIDITVFLNSIDNALHADSVASSTPAKDYKERVEMVINAIATLLEKGHAHHVIELTEYALESLQEAKKSVATCNGFAGEIATQLQALHHKACKIASPDPEYLARRIFGWEFKKGYQHLDKALTLYADLLGYEGIATYRDLVQTEWERLHSSDSSEHKCEEKRALLSRLMHNLAQISGDIEAIVALKSKDLSSSQNYLEIAEIYSNANQADKALEWAERGLKAFPDCPEPKLVEFLVEEYRKRERLSEALALIWLAFEKAPVEKIFAAYQNLKNQALKLEQWEKLQEKAIAYVRQQIAEAKLADHSTLVQIFLWENEIESAWQEAKNGKVSKEIWWQVAEKWGAEHPEEILQIYQSEIESAIARKTNESYAEASQMLEKMRDLMLKINRENEFNVYLNEIRKNHKNKRNFIKLIS